ncbi:MAG TPA: hypothetical protein VNW95_10525 [Mucilaginibacter sp.]|nr:hypothetical protein [Mucilaginibacter sp.]
MLFLNCKKGNPGNPASVKFVGRWQYQYQAGGLTGSKVSPSGAISILILNSDKTYQRSTNGSLQQQGSYKLSLAKSIFTGSNDNAIDFDSSGMWKIISLQKDTLSIADNFADGFGLVYVKMK